MKNMQASNNKLTVTITGIKGFERAVKRNPAETANELKKFFVRSKALYTKTILNNPWRVGASGGGAPVDLGAMRDSHQSGTKILPFSLSFGPDKKVAPYSKYVHAKRPWLNYAFDKNYIKVNSLARDMLKNIVKDLSR